MALICDTSGVYALYDAADAHHQATEDLISQRDRLNAQAPQPAPGKNATNTAKDKAMVYDAKLRDQFGTKDPKTKKKTKLGPGSGKPHPRKKAPNDEL